MMQLSYELARTLAVVSDTGTLDAASHVLDVTPSAVSQRIRALEEGVGRALLVRSKPVRLTDAGRTIVDFAHRTEILEQETLRTLGLAGDTGALPQLTVLIDSGLRSEWLSALGRATSNVPAQITVRENDSTESPAAAAAADGGVSAAVTTQFDAPTGWTSIPLGQCQRVAVASPELLERAVHHDDVTLAAVVRHGNEQLHETYAGLIPGGRPAARTIVDSEHAVLEAVLAGAGWGLVLQPSAAPFIATGQLSTAYAPPGSIVEYYWQRWNVSTPLLDAITAEIVSSARAVLDPISRYQ